jgi:adenine-specific DNA methylase
LGSILPNETPNEFVLKILGIPVGVNLKKAQDEMERAKAANLRLAVNPFQWERAYKHVPSTQELSQVGEFLKQRWGTDKIAILDPMAGGGSIPYEAIRLGLATIGGDLNPVAYICLKGTIEYPSQFREKLHDSVEAFCTKIHEEARRELEMFFPKNPGEEIYAYLWARTIRCSSCSLEVPLSPHWWAVQSSERKIAVQLTASKGTDRCSFTIVEGTKAEKTKPDKGTVHGGDGECPRCKVVLAGDYIKAEAKAGRMGHQLYAISTKIRKERKFRAPTAKDIEAFEKAERRLEERLPSWESKGLVPNESIPEGLKTREPLNFGMPRWCDMFNHRQLLTHLTYLEKFQDAKKHLFNGLKVDTEEYEFAQAIATYGAMVFDTCLNYNGLQSRWHSHRAVMASAMDTQAFPFRWSYAEWDHSQMLWPWALSKSLDALQELVKLLPKEAGPVTLYHGSAAKIPRADKSVHCVVVDPPYAENVMYAEVSDYFYVWLKRLLGDVFRTDFLSELTEKAEEVVSNPARFKGFAQGGKNAARADYASKMESCFREMRRVLIDDGIMTVMFTHREGEAWSALATGLMRAGFTFRASWPVHTEPGEKFAKREKGMLKVTVLLVCHKRDAQKPGIWEYVRDELREMAKQKLQEYSKLGIEGPDLRVSVYGPVLGRFADYFPIKTATGKEIDPKEALDLVVEVLNERFLEEENLQGVDNETAAYLNLLKEFPSGEVDYDSARLATVFGGNVTLDTLDLKGGLGLIKKEKGKVALLSARGRVSEGALDVSDPKSLRCTMDVVHASIVLYSNSGVASVRKLLHERTLDLAGSPFPNVLGAYARYADEASSESLRMDASSAKPLLDALGYSSGFTKKKGESLDDHF